MIATEQNPLLEGLQVRRRPEPCVLVIFGASGDLTQRKLMPALYSLAFRRLLPERFAVVGAARSKESDDDFRERMKEAVQRYARDEFRQEVWEELAAGMRYCPLDFADEAGEDELTRLRRSHTAERPNLRHSGPSDGRHPTPKVFASRRPTFEGFVILSRAVGEGSRR